MTETPETRTPRVPAEASAEGSTESQMIPVSGAAVGPALDPDDQKRAATLIAAFALKAHTVVELRTGGYLVASTAWAGCQRHCADLDALAEFGRQLGVRT